MQNQEDQIIFPQLLPLPGSVSARTNSLENLFIIGSGAILESDSLTINVDDSADGLFNSVIEVSGGTIRGEKLNIQISDNSTVIGLYIGKGTEAENIAIENSNPGKIDIDKNNNNSKDILNNITEKNPSIPQDDITTRFDAANAEDFFYNLFYYEKVILTDDFSITYEDLTEYEDWQASILNSNSVKVLDAWKITKSLDIDLNGHALTSNIVWRLSDGNSEISISNGILDIKTGAGSSLWNIGAIGMNTGSSLTMKNTTYTTDITGIVIGGGQSNVKLSVESSTIDVDGYYCISTNASDPTVENITVDISNSELHSENYFSSMGILFNIEGTLNINNTTISSLSQTVIARGGTHKYSNSTFISTGENQFNTGSDFSNCDWKDGNSVPLATLVIGNRNTGYQYPTDMTLENITIVAPVESNPSNGDSLKYHGVFIWQNDITNTVTVRDTLIEDTESVAEPFINTDMNGADVNDLQDKPEGLDVSVLPTGSVSGSPVALHPYG